MRMYTLQFELYLMHQGRRYGKRCVPMYIVGSLYGKRCVPIAGSLVRPICTCPASLMDLVQLLHCQ